MYVSLREKDEKGGKRKEERKEREDFFSLSDDRSRWIVLRSLISISIMGVLRYLRAGKRWG